MDGCDLVVNLSGRSVNCRYTTHNKREIFDSRTNPTAAGAGHSCRSCAAAVDQCRLRDDLPYAEDSRKMSITA